MLPDAYGHAPRGHRVQLQDVFVRGKRYLLCAALTTEAYIALTRVVQSSFDGFEFSDFIAEEFVCY